MQRDFTRHSYYAEVSSERTNLSPFTKDYRGLALKCDFTLYGAREGTRELKTKQKHKTKKTKSNNYLICVYFVQKVKTKVLPGLEPGSKDSKSLVMTITL